MIGHRSIPRRAHLVVILVICLLATFGTSYAQIPTFRYVARLDGWTFTYVVEHPNADLIQFSFQGHEDATGNDVLWSGSVQKNLDGTLLETILHPDGSTTVRTVTPQESGGGCVGMWTCIAAGGAAVYLAGSCKAGPQVCAIAAAVLTVGVGVYCYWTQQRCEQAPAPSPGGTNSHTIGAIYHGISYTLLSGADRHHAWTEHSHSSKYAAVWHCNDDNPTCADKTKITFGCDNISTTVSHVDCDSYADRNSLGYHVTHQDGLVGKPCASNDMEGPKDRFNDGHGMCDHHMLEAS